MEGRGDPNVCGECLPGYVDTNKNGGEPVCEKMLSCSEGCTSCWKANDPSSCYTCENGYSARTIIQGVSGACDKNPLSGGAITGIVIGVIAVLAIAGGLAAFFIIKSKKANKGANTAANEQDVASEQASA